MEEEKIVFKKKTKRNLRIRKNEDEDENNEDDLGVDLDKLNELKELREFKKSQLRGLNAEELLSLKCEATGKIVKGSASSSGALTNDVNLGNTFSVETNRLEEDAEMLKFIEKELAKRKGADEQDMSEIEKKMKLRSNLDEIVFDELPEHLLNTNKSKNEEMLSNQMLSGIPEIALDFEAKVRNIEATEEAKRKALLNSLNKASSDKETSYAPNNMAVNYVQHNKFSTNTESKQQQNKKPKVEPIKLVKEPVVNVGETPMESIFKVNTAPGERQLKHPGKEKASDDYHYEMFKKKFRK